MRTRISIVIAGVIAAALGTILATPAQAWVGNLQPDYARSPGTNVEISRTYEHINGTGNYYRWWTGAQCTSTYSDYDGWERSLSQESFNNTMSSLRTYNRCDMKLYDGDNFVNPHYAWWDGGGPLMPLVDFNDKTNSIDWS